MLVLIPVVAFAPVIFKLYRRFSKSACGDTGIHLSLFNRCVCVLLSYVMFLGPVVLDSLAQGQIQYSGLCTADWAKDDSISYTYDLNGAVETKTSTTSGNTTESVTYEYNLQNRLWRVSTTTYTGGVPDTTVSVVEYTYNPSGIRTQKDTYDTDDGGTTSTNEVVTDYLIDPYNHTGYAQVLEETSDDGTNLTRIQYTIGDDVISQTTSTYSSGWSAGGTQYLLYDGHGSTRQLIAQDKSIIDEYSYDGYGVMLGGNPTPADQSATNLLYTGEQFDSNLSQYYLRARYYNQNNGRFNRVDPFAGNTTDPQSLHKYTYCHNNPVNGIDPSGESLLLSFTKSTAIMGIISGIVFATAGVLFDIARGGASAGEIARNALVTFGIIFTSFVVPIFMIMVLAAGTAASPPAPAPPG